MKLVRLLLTCAAALLVLGLVALAVALTSGFQTWMVRRALAARPDVHLTIGRVAAGFEHVDLTDVHYEHDGLRLEVPTVAAQLPLLALLFQHRLDLKHLDARGWTVTLPAAAAKGGPAQPGATHADATSTQSTTSGARVAGTTSAAPGFDGILPLLRLPLDVTLGRAELRGSVVLPHGGGVARVAVQGGDISVGRAGSFTVGAELELATGAVKTLKLDGRAELTMDSPRTFSTARARLTATAIGAHAEAPVTLDGDLKVQRRGSVEQYAVTLTRGDRPVLAATAEFPTAQSRIDGTWSLDLRDADVTPFLLGRAIPEFSAAGQGQLESDTTFDNVRASGAVTAHVDQLARLFPDLVGVGPVNIKGEVDVAQHGAVFTVTQFNAVVGNEHPVATVHALQAFAFNGQTREVRATNPASELVGITLHRLPLAWVRPFAKGMLIEGGDAQGEFVAMPRAGGFSFRSQAPLTIPHLALSSAGTPWVRDLDVSLSAAGDYTPLGWQAELNGFSARSGASTVLLLNAKAGRLAGANQPVKATGLVSVDLAGIAAQPLLQGVTTLKTGTATADFSASVGTSTQVQATIEVKNLTPAAAQPELPAISAQLRADVSADHRITCWAPISLQRAGRKSDLTLTGSYLPAGRGGTINAQVSSANLVVDDLRSLAAVMAPTGDAPAVGPDRSPWQALNGSVALRLQNVVYTNTLQVKNVTGTVHFSGGTLTLDNVHAGVGVAGDARLSAAVTFDPKAQPQFALGADVALVDFDPGALFAAASPQQPPTVEGRFTITSKLSARATTLAGLRDALTGNAELTSKGGVFRGLPVNVGNLVENSSKLASWLASAGNAITSLAGRKDYDEITSRSQAANELARILSTISYDQLGIVVTRDEALNLDVPEFTLISPEIRISGTGRARRLPGQSVVNDIVDFDLRLRARGRPAELMKYLGVLDQKPDDLGYAACTIPVKVEGSLVKLDTTQLSNRLVALAVEKTGLTEKAVDWINRLRGKSTN